MASEEKFDVEEGSAPITEKDIIKMFWVLLRQNQENNPGTVMQFPLGVFKTLPKKLEITFEKKDGVLHVSVPYETKRTKKVKTPKAPQLVLPQQGIIVN